MPAPCPICQHQVNESATFCERCGTELRNSGHPVPPSPTGAPPEATPAPRHALPKCLACGTITAWQVEPVLLAHHFIVGGVLLLFCGSGLVYWLTVALMRSNPASRAKICPRCGGRNMWTFMY